MGFFIDPAGFRLNRLASVCASGSGLETALRRQAGRQDIRPAGSIYRPAVVGAVRLLLLDGRQDGQVRECHQGRSLVAGDLMRVAVHRERDRRAWP